jgi:cytochrome c-type biogenesis protein CcmH
VTLRALLSPLRAALVALGVALLLAVMPARADEAFEQRLKRLETDLRCLVCQNQTLADSGAGLADDLRREVRSLAMSGKSDDEIRAFLVARYGDFVLYDPPLKPRTWLLWFGPFALLLVGLATWWLILRRRARNGGPPPPESGSGDVERARRLIDDDET